MNTDEARKRLQDQVRVTPQQVMIAKGYIINHFNANTSIVISEFLKSIEAAAPEKLVIHLTVDTEESIKSIVKLMGNTILISGLPHKGISLGCLSLVMGNYHAGFLGGKGAVTPLTYPVRK